MKIYLASAETETSYTRTLNPIKAPHLLMSYYYLRRKNHKSLINLLDRATSHSDFIFLDSGAHTFLSVADLKGGISSSKSEDPRKYMEEYFLWLEKYHHYFTVVAELDVAGVQGVSYSEVESWRERFKIMGMKDKLVVVSHSEIFPKIGIDWEKEWERLLGIYPYLAIGDQPSIEVLNKYFYIWNKVGNYNRIHGFAETKGEKIKVYPYFSVDSTTRNSGSRFGLIKYYDKKNIDVKDIPIKGWNTKDKRIKSFESFRKYFNLLEPDTRKLSTIDSISDYTTGSSERDSQNARAYIRLEEEVTKLWKFRGIDFDKNPPKVLGL